jgi:hypothetical protein
MAKKPVISEFVIAACMLWFIFCSVAFSNVGHDALTILIALCLAGIWMAIWFTRLAAFLTRLRSGKEQQMSRRFLVVYWGIEPTVLVLSTSLSAFGVFSGARFALSLPSLETYIEPVRSGEFDLVFEFQHPPRYIGLYSVTATELLPDGTVRMVTSPHLVLDRAALANSLSNPPPRRGEDFYRNVYGHWWYWYESW